MLNHDKIEVLRNYEIERKRKMSDNDYLIGQRPSDPYLPEVSAIIKERFGLDTFVRPMESDPSDQGFTHELKIGITFTSIPKEFVPIYYTDPLRHEAIPSRVLLTVTPSGMFRVVLTCIYPDLSNFEWLANKAIDMLYLAYPQLKPSEGSTE